MKHVLFACVAYAAMSIAAFGADDAPIGVFDSGLGGLTVLERLLDVDQVNNATGLYGPDGVPDLAHERFTYLGDQANMPYGDYAAEGKSDYLRELILKDAKFLLSTNYYRCDREATPSGTKQRVKIIVIACNTATAWGLDDVRKYLASVGDGTKVVGVIEAGVRATLDHVAAKAGSKPFALGVMATPGTIASGAYERTIRTELKARGVACEVPVINQGCAGLADAVEAGSPTADSIARSNLISLVERYRASGKTAPIKAVILGCTHYPFVLATLEKTVAELRAKGAPFAEDFRFVDPAFYTAAESHRILRESRRLTGSKGPTQVNAFLSVANPALPPECLTPDGQLTRQFKYGRNVGSAVVTTKPVPLTRERFGDDLFKNIGRLLPRTAAKLSAEGASPAAQANPLKFLSLNIWGDYFDNPVGERDAAMEAAILKDAPDIVSLQEVTTNWWASPMFRNLEKAGYGIVRGDEEAALRRAAFTGTRTEKHINHEPLLYRKDRLALLDCGTEFFHVELQTSKSVTWAVLEDKISKRRFVAFATHFWWQSNGEESDTIRELNARHVLFLLSDIRRKWGADLPAILGGDLNSREESLAHMMLKSGGFLNAASNAEIKSPHCSHHGNPVRGADGKYHGRMHSAKTDKPEFSIDHIYFTKGIHALRHEIGVYQEVLDITDHSPVLVEFAL